MSQMFYDQVLAVASDGPSQLHLDILKQHFGHSGFRPMQWKIIAAILNRQDNFAVMATGYGKSLCFQYPPVFMDGVGLVISPLISLMEDQVLALNVSNIPACFLGSAQPDKKVFGEVLRKKYRLVYVTPEFITCDLGDTLLNELNDDLTLIAVDEAHCVSQWGHDFRPSYRQLSTLRQKTRGVPIVAVTATATDAVRDDIVRVLGLQNPLKSCSGFDRANLAFYVHLKGEGGPMSDLKPLIRQTPTGSIIIYCLTRKVTEDLVDQLRGNGIVCEAYHAGMSVTQRRKVHEKFVRDKIRIICATIAFGMGIDKPDVRMVIHYGASKDIEGYYQEVGRAGRDGQPSKCVMFYNRGDFATHAMFRESGNSPAAVKKNLEKLSDKMWDYLNTRECRRLFILKYFEGSKAKCNQRPNCCDNCDRNMSTVKDCDKYEGLDANGKYDFSEDARKLLGVVQMFNGNKGINASVLTLRGSKAKTVPAFAQSSPHFGAGKHRPEEWWKSLAILLDREGFLEKRTVGNSGGYRKKFKMAIQCVAVTHKGQNWMKTAQALRLLPTTEMYPHLARKNSLEKSSKTAKEGSSSASTSSNLGSFTPTDDLQQELVRLLLETRVKLAEKLDIMPYMISSNVAITQLATARPINLQQMEEAKLDGFNRAKILKFGPDFIKVIQEKLGYVPEKDSKSPGNALKSTQSSDFSQKMPSSQPKSTQKLRSMKDILRENPLQSVKLTPTIQECFQQFEDGMSIEEIAITKDVKSTTVLDYLAIAIKCGLPLSKNDFPRLGIDDDVFKIIKSKLPASFGEGFTLKKVKDQLPHFSWESVRIVVSYVHVRWHLDQLGYPYVDPDRPISSQTPPKTTKISAAKSPETILLDDDDDGLLREMELPEKPQAATSNWLSDDEDDELLAAKVASLEEFEREKSRLFSQTQVTQDSAYGTFRSTQVGKRPSTEEILSQFEAKKAKIQSSSPVVAKKVESKAPHTGLKIDYGVDSSDDEKSQVKLPSVVKAAPLTSTSSNGWMNKSVSQTSQPVQNLAPKPKKPFVFKTKKIF
ncbi:bifunctional 3'-5' exonuclease/ATP-dependent helicase WRN-like [Culicoides brevitarsis]|uniref:bifunctional 3'-5' exonuclease/ATP-dependent helicase WRN-like n=1 Tax=Culicoides brevitarsis TaxID=469753 RepID=UPI00307C8D3E